MLNFLHNPCCADGDKAIHISNQMKNKINNIKKNELEHLMILRMGTQKFPYSNMSDLTDFPKFTIPEMTENIFFGSSYIQRAKSYLNDIMKNDVFLKINEECIRSIWSKTNENDLTELVRRIEYSKIIGMEILSRHQRSLKKNMTGANGRKDYRFKYKVFIEYLKDSIESINIR